MLDHAGGPNQSRDARDSGKVGTVPFDAEFEVLVSIEAGWICGELCHATEHSIAGGLQGKRNNHPTDAGNELLLNGINLNLVARSS
jgi:hypothetical protein